MHWKITENFKKILKALPTAYICQRDSFPPDSAANPYSSCAQEFGMYIGQKYLA